MNGLDQKEAELARMAQVLQAQQEAAAALEGQKREAEASLAEHQARMDQADQLLQEAASRLRQAPGC